MATPLNAQLRGDILQALLEKSFSGKLKAHSEREKELGRAMYDEVYADWKEAMEALPDDFLPTDEVMRPEGFRDRALHLRANNLTSNYFSTAMDLGTLGMGEDRRVPVKVARGTRQAVSEALKQRLLKHAQQGEKIIKEVSELRDTAKGILAAFRSVEALLKHYPSFAPYIPNAQKQTKALAVRDEDLVTMIKKAGGGI